MKRSIGIYIGQREVIAATVSFEKNLPVLGPFAIERIARVVPPEESAKKGQARSALEPEAQAIERALQKIAALRAHTIATFNPFQLVTRHFEMPLVPRRERQDAIRYEASRHIPFKLSETVLDGHISERPGEGGVRILSVTVSALKTDVLRSYLNHLRSGSAKVDMVEPVYSAFSRALSVGGFVKQGESYGFIFIDADQSVNVTFAHGGITYLSRDFLLSEDRVANETRFYEELKASFDFMSGVPKVGKERIDQIYLAGSGDLVFWSEFLTNVFKNQARFAIGLFPTKQDIPENVLSSLLVPIGLALRGLKQKSPLGELTLLPPVERETSRERLKRLVAIEFLLIALLFILVRLSIFTPYLVRVEGKAEVARSSEAIVDSALVIESVEGLKRIRDQIGNRVRQLGLLAKAKTPMSTRLKALGRSIPDSIWLDQMTYRHPFSDAGSDGPPPAAPPKDSGAFGSLKLEGFCYLQNSDREIQTINEWIQVLVGEKSFSEGIRTITLEDVRRERIQDREVSRFDIRCV